MVKIEAVPERRPPETNDSSRYSFFRVNPQAALTDRLHVPAAVQRAAHRRRASLRCAQEMSLALKLS
jgi:hypothetical protein